MTTAAEFTLTEDSPARSFAAGAGTVSRTGTVHALVDRDGSLRPMCGLGMATPELVPLPAGITCGSCLTQVLSRLVAPEPAAVNVVVEPRRNAATLVPAGPGPRAQELAAQVAELEAALADAAAIAGKAVSEARAAQAVAVRDASLWRGISAAILLRTSADRHIDFSVLEAAAIRSGVSWAQLDESDGMSVLAHVVILKDGLSSAHEQPGPERQG